MKIGDIVIDLGCNKPRASVVVEIDDIGFTVKHQAECLSFPEEHPFHSFTHESREFILLESIENGYRLVQNEF